MWYPTISLNVKLGGEGVRFEDIDRGAERGRFELPRAFALPVFETGALDQLCDLSAPRSKLIGGFSARGGSALG